METKILTTLVLGIVFTLALAGLTFAQITVTAEDAPSTTDIYFEMNYARDVEVSPGPAGENQYWDFSGLNFSGTTFWRPIALEDAPYMNRFPAANIVYKVTETGNDTITYNYAQLTETSLTELGRAKFVGDETTELLVADRATPKLNLPATYGDTEWSSVLQVDTTLGALSVTLVDSSYNIIDAWGTLKTSFGEFPCLRIRQDHSQIAYTLLGALPIEININYFWVTNEKGILMTMTGYHDEMNPNYTQAKSVNVMAAFLTSVDENLNGIRPIEFALKQNYPNPFNPTTTIAYRLNQKAEVSLKVFNIAGQEVGLLVKEQQNPGDYSVDWNASPLPSGIYYYQIKAGEKMQTRKCLLMK